MFNLNSIYRPTTAQPFLSDETYLEVQPCTELKPYVCCFWGTPEPFTGLSDKTPRQRLVIPDTCMDIIISINGDLKRIESLFAGISDKTFKDVQFPVKNTISRIAIRFYSWAVPLFANDSMKNTFNSFFSADELFSNITQDLQEALLENTSMNARVKLIEQYLIKRLDLNKQKSNVMNAIYKVLESKGTANISELCNYTSVSNRHLERLFSEYVGVSPKKLSSLVRYQYLWNDLLFENSLDFLDCVYKYRFSDQSHLINDFKSFHSLTPTEARVLAYEGL